MRLVANIVDMHAEVNAVFNYHGILVPFSLTMVLDTGASCSCLLRDHVRQFGIPFNKLNDAPWSSNTVSGKVTSKLLPRVDLYLPVLTGPDLSHNQMLPFHFDYFEIIPPKRCRPGRPSHRVVSLLGMDVLRYFKNWEWDWDQFKVYLDT